MECQACNTVVDPVWSWCPECGGLLADAPALDLSIVEAELAVAARPAPMEPYPTEWATA